MAIAFAGCRAARDGAPEGKQNGSFRCGSVAKMQAALENEKAGVEFTTENGGGRGAIREASWWRFARSSDLRALQTRKRVAPVVI
jgi:hypothetical protein